MTLTRHTCPLEHPGPVAEARRVSVATQVVTRRVTLPPGTRLLDAMAAKLERIGATSGQFELLDGPMSRISYCLPALCHDGTTAVFYSATQEATVPARLVAGSATVGFRGGERFAHCHASWFDAVGTVRGGHLWPECIIGAAPVEAVMHAFDSVELVSDTDAETRMPVFTPYRRQVGLTEHGGSRAVMSRIRPGVDLHDAVVDIMREQGFRRASIAGSLGSVVGAVLQRDGSVLVVDGPATEVTLTGHFDLAHSDDGWINAVVFDRFGTVHAGTLVPDHNIVAVTLELLVREVSM